MKKLNIIDQIKFFLEVKFFKRRKPIKFIIFDILLSFLILNKKHKILTLFFWLTLIILPAFETLGLGVLALYVGILSNPDAIINKIPLEKLKNLV